MIANHLFKLCPVLLFAAAIGCSPAPAGKWAVTVSNHSAASCGASIELGYKNASGAGSSSASAGGIGKDGSATLLTGSMTSEVKKIKITLDGEEQVLEPMLTIKPGNTLRIIVGADKKVQTKVE